MKNAIAIFLLSWVSETAAVTATQTFTISLPTGTTTYSLNTGTESYTISLPTGSTTYTLDTGTSSYTITLPTGTASQSMSQTESQSISLPTGTVTYTLNTGTATHTISLPTGTVSQTLSLPTSTATTTVSLPTGTSTETISLPTGTGSVTYTLNTGTATHTISLPTGTVSQSVSLPTSTATTTVSLPTGTSTETVSLPTGTVSHTISLPTGTATQSITLPTGTATVTVSLPTGSESASFSSTVSVSLPTGTATETISLPTGTATETISLPTGTATTTFSLPTGTSTVTVSLPTGTATETISLPTGTATETISLPTGTATETISLPTGTATTTFSLPTGTSTVTVSLPTGTATETISLPTGTATETISLPTGTATETISLPTGTATTTFSLPTGTSTVTVSLPTGTATETISLPTGTATETISLPTGTATETISLPTGTATTTFSLPTGTATVTVSLPTGTATETISLPTGTATQSITLPTGTATETISLPTGTSSMTFTLPTGTQSETVSLSLPTLSSTETVSLSLPTATSSVTLTLPTGTETVTLSLPTGTATTTLTLPTGTSSMTFTLPTGTQTETVTLPTGTATTTLTLPTGTATVTLTLPTGTATETFSLPTGTATTTLSLPTSTATVTVSLPTGTATETISLPTGTATETISLPTGTATETLTLPTGTETLTLSLPTATSTLTVTLPTGTATETISLPTGTSTLTLSLPTGTSTLTLTLPTGTATTTLTLPTGTATVSMTLPTGTATETVSLPTGTETLTLSLPTGTSTLTLTLPTGTATTTVTLPTGTASETVSLTLPTASATETVSLTLPTATATETITLPTGTATETLSLPTGTATTTLTLPTGTATVTLTLPTGTATETLTLPTGTATETLTLPTGTDTITLSLPTGTASETLTLPTGTETVTFTMPTGTGTFSISLSLPTASQTFTETFSLPTATESVTVTLPTSTASETISLSLPTASSTATFTYTVPTGTDTFSISLSLPTASETHTYSMTVPTGTDTFSLSLSLPTASETHTYSMTLPTGSMTYTHTLTLPTATESTSLTESLTMTLSLPTASQTETVTMTLPTSTETSTLSISESLPAHNNYTMVFEPYSTFLEGQEVRVALQARLYSLEREHFNTSHMGTFKLSVFEWSSSRLSDCPSYISSGTTPLYVTKEFGMTTAETEEGRLFTSWAHATFVAPRMGVNFVICFRHTVPKYTWDIPDELRKWQLFTQGTEYMFSASESLVWYRVPDATVGQYAVVQLLSDEAWNFTYSSSACGASNLGACSEGDNLKIVPQGQPCTYEYQNYYNYYLGSYFVNTDGTWQPTAHSGLLVGSTPGGVGMFGTQYSNPLTDSWSSWGTYYPANEEVFTDTDHTQLPHDVKHHAYVYVRLPQYEASFDVCFSSRIQRAAVRLENSTLDNLPMWRKLAKCDSIANCQAHDPSLSFTTKNETVSWGAYDLSPSTWGTIIFEDSEAMLSSMPAAGTGSSSPIAASWFPTANPYSVTVNYWAPQGGDYFRIVNSASFTEKANAKAGLISVGSFPSVGCWSRYLDTPSTTESQGGFSDDGVVYPIGSTDLTGDPYSVTSDDASNQPTTFSTLWYPSNETTWHVCYRRTCTTSSCTHNSGLRVLPWKNPGTTSETTDWARLNRNSMLLRTQPKSQTPDVTWYANDTREGTWGPIVIEIANASTVKLDSRQWDFGTLPQYVNATQGSALRVVPYTVSCDYTGTLTTLSANSTDGGLTECNSEAATFSNRSDCFGTASNIDATEDVTFYITVPPTGTKYRVCYRLQGWNWHEVKPSAASSHRLRDGWAPPSDGYYAPSASPTLSLQVEEQRSGMEALFLVRDMSGNLTAAPRSVCDNATCIRSGDVLRLVPSYQECDITPFTWDATLADTHLSLYCEVKGHGTINTTGLFQEAGRTDVCATSIPSMRFCSSTPCNTTRTPAEVHMLTELEKSMPPVYDDIVPHDHRYYSHDSLAGVITLPAISSAMMDFKICYKQLYTANWIIFNASWALQNELAMNLAYPAIHSDLVGGSLQRFSLQLPYDIASDINKSVAPDRIRSFDAKLVLATTGDNSNCLSEPGGTEAAPYGSRTTKYVVGNSLQQLDFYLTVPQQQGVYQLCVMYQDAFMEDRPLSWWRPGGDWSFGVVENSVRWYVTSGNRPTNGGLITVNFVKCHHPALVTPLTGGSTADNTAGCDIAASSASFDTSPGGDSAKIVKIDDSCSSGDAVTGASHWGASTHIGIEGGGALGVTNLGPADGPADVAEMPVAIPRVASDAATNYKVCVSLVVTTGANKVWVEVPEATGMTTQLRIRNQYDSANAFRTQHGFIESWTLTTSLTPLNSLYSGVATDSVTISGASTQYVQNPSSAPVQSDGFTFTLYGTATSVVSSENIFKIVTVARPSSRTPDGSPTWGEVSSWPRVTGADCNGAATLTGSNIGSCTDPVLNQGGLCPSLSKSGLTMTPTFQMPLDPGRHYVCYKVVHTSLSEPNPWLWVPSGSGDYGLHTHPSFLEMEPSLSYSNATVYDLRKEADSSGKTVPLSSWCRRPGATDGEGVPCDVQNSGYTYDLLTVVNDTQVCQAPVSAPLGSATGTPEWFTLIRTGNASAMIWNTWASNSAAQFILPPAQPVASGQYKLCVYKAGDGDTYTTNHVLRRGVVLQLYNRGLKLNGGGSGLWKDAVIGEPTQFVVSTDVSYNSSLQFIEYDEATTETVYGPLVVPAENVTDPVTGKVSRTPLIRSGTIVHYDLRAASDTGIEMPFGSYAVDVLRCPAATVFAELACTNNKGPFEVAVFDILGVDAACSSTEGPLYGWPDNGLKQFLSEGFLRFSVQYRSACPDSEFGCGILFSGNSGTNVVASKPQWINVAVHQPDGLFFNGIEMTNATGTVQSTAGCSSTNPSCFLLSCTHRLPCTINIQTRWGGPPEFAPNNTVTIQYSHTDYTDISVPPSEVTSGIIPSGFSLSQHSGQSWNLGGTYTYTFTPMLLNGINTHEAFFEASYGGPFTNRFAVRVERPAPTAAIPMSVMSMDVEGLTAEREPVPAFFGTVSGTTLTADPGCYLESLVPYRFVFSVMSGTMELNNTVGLGTWMLTAVTTGTTNSVLAVLRDVSGVLMVDNLMTKPTAMTATVTNVAPMGVGANWAVDFRMLNNDGCSRFSGGCSISFMLTDGLSTITMMVQTPVRVVASTIRVVPSVLSATIPAGIQVTALPGTPCGTSCWYADEYHNGDIFALISGPNSNGVTNMLGVGVLHSDTSLPCAYTVGKTCVAYKYAAAQVTDPSSGGTGWGASWVIRTTKPCTSCEFTFHSTLGAGPESFESDTANDGTTILSFTSESLRVKCSASSTTVNYESGSTQSEMFSVTVSAVEATSAEASAVYPRWWVFTSTQLVSIVSPASSSKQYMLQTPTATGTITAKMDASAVAQFTDLHFYAADVANVPDASTPEVRKIIFTAIDSTYSAVHVTGSASYNCSVDVSLTQGIAGSTGTEFRVNSVSNSQTLCTNGELYCSNWQTTVSNLAAGITVDVNVLKTINGVLSPETSLRNITAIPRGGPSTHPAGFVPTSTYDSGSQTWTSQTVTLDSFYNPASLMVLGTQTYTFGAAEVVFTRATNQRNGQDSTVDVTGLGKLSLKYASSDPASQQPARRIEFDICSYKNDGGGDVVDLSLCVRVGLWVLPTTQPTPVVTFTSEELGGWRNIGSGATCGESPTPTSASLLVSYVQPSIPTSQFIVYDASYEYQMSVAGQTLTLEGDISTNTTVKKIVSIPGATAQERLINTLGQAALTMDFVIYGRYVAGTSTVPLSISGSAMDVATQTKLGSVSSTQTYYWVEPAETFTSWEMQTAVTTDDECPRKRFLSTSLGGYQTYQDTPGLGWDYSAAGQVSVDMPFPIQTIVKSPAGRAWTFKQGTYVKVSKKGWSGCNDGGTMNVYYMKPTTDVSELTLRTGDLASSWTQALGTDNVLVPTINGAATVWPVFSARCQACTIQLDLCYTTATSGADCLELGAAAITQSDTTPVFADRTKVTKPFSVVSNEASAITIVTQQLPTAPTQVAAHPVNSTVIQVGDPITLQFGQIRLLGGKWAMQSTSSIVPHMVSLGSLWQPSSSELLDSKMMRYGNGGFMVAGAGSVCSVLPTELGLAYQVNAATVPPTSWPSASVYFTRPCSGCQVQVSYQMTASSIAQTFMLKQYATGASLPIVGPPLVFRVVTCGVKWMFGGVPPVAVRRRKEFALTVIRVDNNNFPSLEGGTSVSATLQTSSSGNGKGGPLIGMSPPSGSNVDGLSTTPHEGSATVRLAMNRACYKCRVAYALMTHDFTVLSDATRFIVTPLSSVTTVLFDNSSDVGTWQFKVYAADDLGDRAYSFAGPSIPPFRPRYAKSIVSPITIGLATRATAAYVPLSTTTLPIASLTEGIPDARLTNGSKILDGIPQGMLYNEETQTGTIAIQLSAASGVRYPVAISSSAGLPTQGYGTFDPPQVGLSVAPTHVAVEDTTSNNCGGTLTQGDKCQFRVFSVGKEPLVTSDAYHLSSFDVGSAAITYNCAPATCAITVPATVPITEGVGTVDVDMVSGGFNVMCNCLITTKLPFLPNAPPQEFTLSYLGLALTSWDWITGGSLAVPQAGLALSESVVDQVVDIKLAALNANGVYTGLGGLTWTTSLVNVDPTAMSPAGCFVCSQSLGDGTCTVSVSNTDQIFLSGYFPSEGTCVLFAKSVLGLPTSAGGNASATRDLSVTVTAVASFALSMSPSTQDTPANFSGLSVVTSEGNPAAIVGIGAGLQFATYTTVGDACAGDYTTNVTVIGTRGGETAKFVVVASGGIAAFNIKMPTTRDAGCTALPCTHTPWMFSAEASYIQTNGTVISLGVLSDIGPLYFMSTAVALQVAIVTSAGEASVDVSMGSTWVTGLSMELSVKGVDGAGAVVSHVEDVGSSSSIVFRPVEAPCMAVDTTVGFMGKTCSTAGSCDAALTFADLPTCGGPSWTLSDTMTDSFDLASGTRNFPMVATPTTQGLHIFLFTTTSFAGNADYVFTAGIELQTPTALTILGTGCGLPAGVIHVCPVPAAMAVLPLEGMLQFTVGNVDSSNRLITSDSTSEVVVTAVCSAAGESSYLGPLKPDGSVNLLVTSQFPMVNGVATISNLYFNGPCSQMVVTLKCLGLCDGKVMDTEPFIIKAPPGSTLAPPPPPAAPIQTTMSLTTLGAMDAAGIANILSDYLATASKADFEKSMDSALGGLQYVQGTTLKFMCALPVTRSSLGITQADRDGTAADGGSCQGFGSSAMMGNSSAAAERVAEALAGIDVSVMAEFDVAVDSGAMLETTALEQSITQQITADLTSPTSILKKDPIFKTADPTSLTTVVALTPTPTRAPLVQGTTYAPPTTAPVTLAPPTAEPTSAPNTSAPATDQPTTEPLPPPPEEPIVVITTPLDSSGMRAGGFAMWVGLGVVVVLFTVL